MSEDLDYCAIVCQTMVCYVNVEARQIDFTQWNLSAVSEMAELRPCTAGRNDVRDPTHSMSHHMIRDIHFQLTHS